MSICGSELKLVKNATSMGPVNQKPYFSTNNVECTNNDCNFMLMFDSDEYTIGEIMEVINTRPCRRQTTG
jgi:hypothetical protein